MFTILWYNCGCAEIDDAIVEFSLPLHLIPRQYQSHSKYHPSEAVQLLSATTNVRIHIPERREITNAYKSRNRDSHFSSSDMLISLEGEVANIFKAVSEFAVAVSTRNACKNITIPQPDDRCRFIGKEGEDAQRTKAEKDNWRDRENDDDDYAALTYEQYVNVPCSLVGLLLVKRDNDLNVMRQIMRGSKTQALKLPEPVLPNSWTGMENQGNDAHERPTTVSEVESEGTISRKKNEEDVGDNGHRLVETFAIRGSSAASVELAASCLLRIVNGDKIATVLSSISNRKVLVDRFGSKRTGVSTSASSNDKTVSLGVSNCEVVDDKVNDRRDRADGAVSLGKKNQKNTVRVDKSGSASRGRGKGGRERGVNVKKSIKSSN